MTRGELLRKELSFPGRPRREIDDEMHRLFLRDTDNKFGLLSYREWLAQEVDEGGQKK